jgi:hypothetical protein
MKMNHYREPFKDPASRKPIWRWHTGIRPSKRARSTPRRAQDRSKRTLSLEPHTYYVSPCQAASQTQEQNAILQLYDATAYQTHDQRDMTKGSVLQATIAMSHESDGKRSASSRTDYIFVSIF